MDECVSLRFILMFLFFPLSYAVNYGITEPQIHRLTMEQDWLTSHPQFAESNFHLSFSLLNYDDTTKLCVIEASNPTLMPGQMLFQLNINSNGTPRLKALAVLKKLTSVEEVLPERLTPPCGPRILSLTLQNVATSRTPLTFHGMLFTPPLETKPPQGFPTLHLVYGGPGVQFVRGVCLRNL